MPTDPKQLRDLARTTNERAREVQLEHDRKVDDYRRARGLPTVQETRDEQFLQLDADIARRRAAPPTPLSGPTERRSTRSR